MVAAPPTLRVLTIVWRLSQGGGVPIVIRRLADGINRERVDLHVVTARPALADDALGEVPATVHALGHTGSSRRLWDRLRTGLGVARVARRVGGDVVHVHGGAPWLWLPAKLAMPRTPFVLEVHDAPGSGRHSATTDRIEGTLVRALRMTAVCHSSSVAGEIHRRWKLRPDRTVVFPLAVDTAMFTPAGPELRAVWREAHGIPPEAFVLIGVGRFVPSKRFHLAVEVLAALRRRGADAWLVLVGGGGEQATCEQAADRHGVADRVVFTGSLPVADLAAALSSADVLVSTSAYEGFGLTLAEAAASGTPTVAMAVGGVTDIVVNGQTGYLVPDGDVAAMTDRLAELAGDRERRSKMGRAARARAEQAFNVTTMADRFTEVYQHAVQRRR